MIKVLIVDGSALDRKRMSKILAAGAGIDVIGTAMNPRIAGRKIELLRPDVVTFDVAMLEAEGIGFLGKLMQQQPLPVVMVSTSADACAERALDAFEIGAVDYACKPWCGDAVSPRADDIVRKIKAAARANLASAARAGNTPGSRSTAKPPGAVAERPVAVTDPPGPVADTRPPAETCLDQACGGNVERGIIAIGASTGGTEAIRDVLQGLNPGTPGIVISQHIPGSFSRAFAERLDQSTAIEVCEARDGLPILPGHAYIAPGDRHLRVVRKGREYRCRLDDGPPVNRHRPSVDVMFRSVVAAAGAGAVGVLLTGMGDDGAEALGLLRDAGAATIVQDEASSVVWGMPGEAVRLGHADFVLPLARIADKIARCVSKTGQKD